MIPPRGTTARAWAELAVRVRQLGRVTRRELVATVERFAAEWARARGDNARAR